MSYHWSPQQHAIFHWFKAGSGHLVVRARAGTGKTTTILEGINHAPESQIILCAFNKRIAEELGRRLQNPHASAQTLHSLGFREVRRMWPTLRVDQDRGFRLAKQEWAARRGGLAEDAPDLPASLIARLAGVVKNVCPGWPPSKNEVIDLAYTHNIVPENGWAESLDVPELAELALGACERARHRDGTLDFDDMLFLPVVHRWARPTAPLIVVDEAQDMNPTQLALARMLASGRIAVVGDDKQAIYGWRGADIGALDRLKADLDAQELPLTITYRCPRLIVAQAQPLCPDYEAAPEAPEGEVVSLTESEMFQRATPSDFILSRLNAPLARLCLTFLRQGRPARIEGRDLTKSLTALIRRFKVTTVPELMERLHRWTTREIERLNATRRKSTEHRVEFLLDQLDTLDALSEGLATVEELLTRLQAIFGGEEAPNGRPCIRLSTVHRAKGLEADRVFVLVPTLYCYGKRQSAEEQNIHYVALTRARQTLVLVTDGGK